MASQEPRIGDKRVIRMQNLVQEQSEDTVSMVKSEANYDDTVGLLTTLGVVAALLLSIGVGLMLSVDPEFMQQGDYRNAILHHAEFRKFVVQELEILNFNFTQSVGLNTYVDVKALLTKEWHTPAFGVQVPQSFSDADVIFHLTKTVFPIQKTAAWASQQNQDLRSFRYLGVWCALSNTVFTISLIVSVVGYITLALSDSAELQESHPAVLHAFNRFNMPMLLVAYIGMGLMGAFACYRSVEYAMMLTSPAYKTVTYWSRWFTGALCCVVLIVFIYGLAFFQSRKLARAAKMEMKRSADE